MSKHAGGRPAVMMPCGWCRVPQSLSAMRAHATVCSRRGVFETPPEGTTAVEVWLDEDRIGQFERAAKRENKSVSEWLRDLGTAAIAPSKDPDAFPDFGTQRGGPITVVAINQKPVQSEPDEMLKIRVIDPAPPRTEEGFDLIVTEELTREEFMERYSRTPEEQKDYLEQGCAVGLGFVRMEEVPEPEPNITQRSATQIADSINNVLGLPKVRLGFGPVDVRTAQTIAAERKTKIPEDW